MSKNGNHENDFTLGGEESPMSLVQEFYLFIIENNKRWLSEQPMQHSLRIALLAAAAMACRLSAAAEFIPLGDLFGGLVSSSASAVSDGGNWVVGNSKSVRSQRVTEGFRWTQAIGLIPLGDLPGGQFGSSALDVSADGSAVAGIGATALGNEAFLFTSAGLRGLGDLSGGSVSSAGRGISADGQIVVGSSSSSFGIEAFRWTNETGMIGLGDLPGGKFFSSAAAISADNRVIVGTSESFSGEEAFRWTELEGMVGLGDLPGGTFVSEASDVSADGSVIVGTGSTPSGPQAFRWTETAGITGLGWLTGGNTFSEAQGTSADGSIVVGFSGTGMAQQAFIWTQENGLESLQEVLVQEFELADALDGWRLISANDVSPDGLFIVGTGINPAGNDEGWLVRLVDLLPGDYNGNGQVEQADLDLVLLNWGKTAFPPPSGWARDLPQGTIDQQELDGVLLNWGDRLPSAAITAAAVPEPRAWILLALCAALALGISRGR